MCAARPPGRYREVNRKTDMELPGEAEAGRFSGALLAWHRRHGRMDLPWHRDNDPYRVWLSEIMLQQTRVSAVIPYFERFVARFPTLESLADADVDDVLHHWSGLGYYARARNLHRAARMIVTDHGGRFPDTLESVMALPGVGRSTAGAILAFCFNRREPILDGNVKRVLARFFCVPGYPGDAPVNRMLWSLADRLTPAREVGRYTQAIMDLGATVCIRSRPACPECPLKEDCRAHSLGKPGDYPAPRRKKTRPVREIQMLLVEDPEGRFLLERRPQRGVWGGLWSLPEAPVEERELRSPLPGYELEPALHTDPDPIRHGFTHFELMIHPRRFRISAPEAGVMDAGVHLWYNPAEPPNIGLPVVVSRLLASIQR